MCRSRQQFAWRQTGLIASLLEGCRQVDTPLDVEKWMPEHLRTPKPKVRATKEEIKAFRAVVAQGKGSRK